MDTAAPAYMYLLPNGQGGYFVTSGIPWKYQNILRVFQYRRRNAAATT